VQVGQQRDVHAGQVVPQLGVGERPVRPQRPAARAYESVDLADRRRGVTGRPGVQDRLVGKDDQPGVIDGGGSAGQGLDQQDRVLAHLQVGQVGAHP
jgi:hypothetical protein